MGAHNDADWKSLEFVASSIPRSITVQSKVALVTGASRGIGRAIALRLARDGIRVVVNYASRSSDAQKVVQEIEAAGGTALPVQADVSLAPEVVRLFDETITRFGKLDILVNNAGLMIGQAY